MTVTGKGKKRRKNVLLYFYLLLILFTLWVSASYTWFSISRTPRVSNMGLTVAGQSGLELATTWNAEEWFQLLDISEQVEETVALKPVTWVDSKQKFFAASYGTDGRIMGIDKEMSDEDHTNRNDVNGYYFKTSVYARTGAKVEVSLMEASTNEAGASGTYVIGTPVWNSESILHNNGGNGAEYTIRVGLRITKLDLNGNEKANSVQFYVYEPNVNGHVDGSVNEVDTPSIDGNKTLVSETQLIRQTTTSWKEAYPVQHNVVLHTPGKFLTDTHLFDLNPDELAKIDIYVWMEGQDIDCDYHIGTAAMIMANIQLNSEAEDQSGLEEFR